jgi:oxygen-independent coproporphyrinogen-3 oxidase
VANALPDGEPVPDSGRLPAQAIKAVGNVDFGAYVHVPFCAVRCGYCDFNTYTASELDGSTQEQYVHALLTEVRLATDVLPHIPPLSTVFFGGGTPTLLPPDSQRLLLSAVVDGFGLADDAEVTTEANPESVNAESLRWLREAGFNRISFGMQSAVPHVLTTLDRQHTPGRVSEAVREARAAGFDSVSLDLIYGTPGESAEDWVASLDAAVALEPDHISAYALIVEKGTAMARRIESRELPPVDYDDQAAKYERADAKLRDAGYEWYEVSNWTHGSSHRSKHNVGYWNSADWWGFGPGAHSHVGGVRWWNVKHPRAYAQRLAAGHSPALAREVLDVGEQHTERLMLSLRMSGGLRAVELSDAERAVASDMVAEQLLDADAWASGQTVLTLRGRLLADHVVRRLSAA